MRAGFLAFLMLLLGVAPAHADRFTLRYDGFGLGFIPVGGVVIDANVGDDYYEVTTNLESRGIFNLFERTNIQASASGVIEDGRVAWRRYDLDHHYARKHRIIHMEADRSGVTATINPNFRLWGNPPASPQQKRISRDPLSTIIAMAVDISHNQHCAGQYPTFDGRFHYVMSLSGNGSRRNYRGGGYNGPVLECDLTYAAVSGFEATDNGRRRITQGHIVFALGDPSFAPPVRISTPLSAGGAVIRLNSWRRVDVQIEDQATPAGLEAAPDDGADTTSTPAPTSAPQ